MKPTHIEHIAIAVRSLAEAVPLYEKLLGTKCYGIEEVADQKAKTAFFSVGATKIELLESTSEDSPIAKFIEKRGEGLHHIAFAVEAIEQALQELERSGAQLIDHTPRKGAEGLEIAFVHSKSAHGVLIELTSKPKA
jgi:methylmalonyl-CoA/ethylmalonyl-CoA epimerase